MIKKKGVAGFSAFLKIALIILVTVILAFTLKGMFEKTTKAVLNVVDKQYSEFKFAQGVLYHPDLDQKYIDFWSRGVKPSIEAAIKGKTPCVGSFYAPGDLNLKGVEFRFVMDPGKGINIFMLDEKGTVALLDSDTLSGERWNLCVIDNTASLLGQSLREGLSGNSGYSFSNLQLTSVDDLYIKIYNLESDEGRVVGYYTKELRQQINQQEQSGGTSNIQEPTFFYPPYKAGQSKVQTLNNLNMRERYHFFFFVKENNFCIVKTQQGTGLYPADFKEFINNRRDNLKSLGWLSSTVDSPICDAPKNDNLFEGDRAAFYQGCTDLENVDQTIFSNGADYDLMLHNLCIDMSTKHPKLCFVSNTDCLSCQKIKTCSDYPKELCNSNPCRINELCNFKAGGFLSSGKCVSTY
jgi:hypothetical protein